ncbi:YybH family protein [Roseibium sp.]|uniref:YybH family protein n=1 Tax=Roseibium sp. TaxID=1936156 RepID=UPI003BA976B4
MSDEQEFQSVFDAYVGCYRSADAAGCAALFSHDAELFSPYGPPAVGRAAIEAAHLEWFDEDAVNKKIEVRGAGRSGDLGWCLALYSEGDEGQGTSLNVLQRQAGGNWLILRCSLNEIPVAGPTAS